MSRLARAARIYAEALGYAVFPLVPGTKYPFAGQAAAKGPHLCPSGHQHQNGHTNATTDLSIIDAWWQAHPDANIGMATGKVSNVSVLDVDIKPNADPELNKRGDITLDALVSLHGSLDDLVWMTTWSGGRQYFGRYNPRARQGVACYGPHLDGRNDGGYTVLPPSVVRKDDKVGEYVWAVDHKPTQIEMPPFPLWLIEEAERIKPAATGDRPKNPEGWADMLMLAGAPMGQREHEAHRLIARCHALGYSETECLAMLFLFGSRCAPPFDLFKDARMMGKVRRVYAQPSPGEVVIGQREYPVGRSIL